MLRAILKSIRATSTNREETDEIVEKKSKRNPKGAFSEPQSVYVDLGAWKVE
jgi:hypothetical protein